MIPPINIDVSEIIDSFSLDKEQTEALMKSTLNAIVDEFMSIWESNIGRELKGTRGEYKRAIFVDRIDDFNVIVGLSPRASKLALMLEEGASPFDIKEGFAKSSKRKFNKDGKWFLTVPFRFATPGALGESSAFSGRLPSEVHKLAKEKASVDPGKGLTGKELPRHLRERKKRSPIITGTKTFAEYEHKNSIYEGVAKRTFGTDSSYTSFRRVSENSDADSWIHKGFVARKLMEKSLSQMRIQDVVTVTTDNFLDNI